MQKPFVRRNQHGANESLACMMKPEPKRQHINEACDKIAKVIQAFPEF